MDTMTRVREHYEIAKTIVPEKLIVGAFLFGSQNYGIDDEHSDVDTKVLVVPSLTDIICARRALSHEHHCENGEHICFMDIREFVHQILKQNPNALEILFTEFYVLNPTFEELWNGICSQREIFARLNTCKALDTMRHIANKEYYQMIKRGFNNKRLATMLRMEVMMYEYEVNCEYSVILKVDNANFFKDVKRGNFVKSDEEGMRLAEDCFEAINKLADRHLKYVPDEYDEKNVDKLMTALGDFVCKHLEHELEERKK